MSMYAVPLNNPDKQPNETSIYRNPRVVGMDLFNLSPHLRTLHDIFRHRFQNPNADFIGWRKTIPGTKNLESHYTWKSNGLVQQEA